MDFSRTLNLDVGSPPPPYVTATRGDVGGLLLSVTVGNFTTGTVVEVRRGAHAPTGVILWPVGPGGNVTLPIEAMDGVTFTFDSSYPDGRIYLHASQTKLAASGFQAAVPAARLWDQGLWDTTPLFWA